MPGAREDTSESKDVVRQERDKPDALRPRGVKAIQGEKELPRETATDLQEAVRRARREVPEHVATRNGQMVEFYKLRGRVGEELVEKDMPGAVNLNDATGKSNFANFDVVSPSEVASVKVKGLGRVGKPRYADYDKYFRDIVNPGSKANRRAAEDLLAIRQDSPEIWRHVARSLPSEVVRAEGGRQMAGAMAEKSSLRIPVGQVARLRSRMESGILETPSRYGIDPSGDEAAIQLQARRMCTERIRPISPQITAEDMGQAVRTGQKPGDSSGIRR